MKGTTVTQNVTVNVCSHRRRWRFPLLPLIGFTIAFFWPKAVWHGLTGSILEGVWIVILAAVWSVVLVARMVHGDSKP